METPRVPARDAMHQRFAMRTRWSDEDVQGVVNNAVYLTLLEEARHRWATECGVLEENRFPFVLAQCNVLFTAPGRGGADVIVEMATTHVGTTSFTQAYRVVDAHSGTTLCEAEARLVAWDTARQAKGMFDERFRHRLKGA